MNIADFMTRGVHTVRPNDSLESAAAMMWEHDCGCAPVVDHEGRVLSMITDRDVCMAAFIQGKSLKDIPVASAMSRRLITCADDDTTSSVEAMMREHQIRRVPVVDGRGRLVGIVSLNDIVLEASTKPTEMAVTLAAICKHHDTALAPKKREPASARRPFTSP